MTKRTFISNKKMIELTNIRPVIEHAVLPPLYSNFKKAIVPILPSAPKHACFE